MIQAGPGSSGTGAERELPISHLRVGVVWISRQDSPTWIVPGESFSVQAVILMKVDLSLAADLSTILYPINSEDIWEIIEIGAHHPQLPDQALIPPL